MCVSFPFLGNFRKLHLKLIELLSRFSTVEYSTTFINSLVYFCCISSLFQTAEKVKDKNRAPHDGKNDDKSINTENVVNPFGRLLDRDREIIDG